MVEARKLAKWATAPCCSCPSLDLLLQKLQPSLSCDWLSFLCPSSQGLCSGQTPALAPSQAVVRTIGRQMCHLLHEHGRTKGKLGWPGRHFCIHGT